MSTLDAMDIEPARCTGCGGEWFTLVVDDETGTPGRVAFDQHGHVTAWAGAVRCEECGERWEPGQRRLRSVN